VTIQPYEDTPHYQHTDSWVPVVAAVGDLASKIAGTEFVGKGFRGKPASTAAAILTGRELGLGPMASLRGLQVIDGSVSMTAQMMAGKILAAGHKVEWVDNTDKAAEVRITRCDGQGEATVRFTLADAQRAGLAGKSNWQKYPRAMMRARALSECAGMICADVILGLEAADDTQDTRTGPVENTTISLTPMPVTTGDVHETEPETVEKLPETAPKKDDNMAVNPPQDGAETAPKPDLLSPAQMRKIGAQIGEYERGTGTRLGRDDRRTYIATLAGLDHLDSAKDLTKDQASTVIEALDAALRAIPVVTDSDGTEGQP